MALTLRNTKGSSLTYTEMDSNLTYLEDLSTGVIVFAQYTVSTLPDATINNGGMIAVTDETGGYTMAFSDGTDWRRVQDRAIVS